MKDDGNEQLDLEALKVGWREVGGGLPVLVVRLGFRCV